MGVNWCDERYVKLYTRDTPTWRQWPWEARALFPCLLRVVDNAGMIDVGTRDPIDALVAMVLLPRHVVEVGLLAMSDSGTAELVGGNLILPKFVEAQEARKTNARSKKDQRERVKAMAKLHAVTQPNEVSMVVRQTEADGGRRRQTEADGGRRRLPPSPSPSPSSSPSSGPLNAAPPSQNREVENAPLKTREVATVTSRELATRDARAAPMVEKAQEAFHRLTGATFVPSHRDWLAVPQLLAISTPEGVLERWCKSLQHDGFPRVRSLSELADHWNHFATDSPGRPAKAATKDVRHPTQPHVFDKTGEVKGF